MKKLIDNFINALQSMDRLAVKRHIEELSGEHKPLWLIENLIAPALTALGEGWERGDVALSQVYMSGRICEELVDSILPPADNERKNQPPMAITVLEDYHMLGKRIVYSVLRAGGFELTDYGRLSTDELVDRINSDKPEVVLISVLMLPSALKIGKVKENINTSTKIIAGGAPFIFDNDLGKEVGVDEVGKNASDAIDILNKLSRVSS